MPLEQVELTSRSGRRLACTLRRPASGGHHQAVVLLGGIGTGRAAVTLIHPRHDVLVLSCDYPWSDPSRLPLLRVLPQLRALRGDLLATPQALALAGTYLLSLPEADSGRLVAIGASLGVPFVSAWAASDPRVAAVALVYGGGDLAALFDANLGRIVRPAPLRHLAARALGALLADLDPARTIGGIAPRPVLLVGSREDQRVPEASREALVRAARAPRTLVWLPGRHILPRDTALLREITDTTVAWLRSAAPALSPAAPTPHLSPRR